MRARNVTARYDSFCLETSVKVLDYIYKFTSTVTIGEHLPRDWAMTQNSLAELYEYMEKWAEAIKCYHNVYKVDPDYAAKKLQELSQKITASGPLRSMCTSCHKKTRKNTDKNNNGLE